MSSLFSSVRICVRMQHIMLVVKLLIKVAVPDVPTGVELSIHRVWRCVTLPDATLIMLCTLHACASKLFFAFIPLRDCISVSPIVTPCQKALHFVHGVLYALCSLLVWHCRMLRLSCYVCFEASVWSHSGMAYASPIATPCKKALHIVHGELYTLCSLLVWHWVILPDAMLIMLCLLHDRASLLSQSGMAYASLIVMPSKKALHIVHGMLYAMLPVRYRIIFKLCPLTYQTLSSMQLEYLLSLFIPALLDAVLIMLCPVESCVSLLSHAWDGKCFAHCHAM